MSWKVHFLNREQFRAADDRRMALGQSRGGGAALSEVVEPCAMWESWWYFDPGNPDHIGRREKAMALIAAGQYSGEYFLSKFYWKDWSDKRPPLSVLCPNGVEWCVDRKSSNGEGWKVTGTAPLITAHPSIDVTGFHGWLKEGVFTKA